jgi:hypothetical protein
VLSWLDTTWCSVLSYILALTITLLLGLSERRTCRISPSATSSLWPGFWFATTILLLAMATGRATDSGELLAEFGRAQARSEGWYRTRRTAQAWVVGAIATAWIVTVFVAIWRVPERRRRYLPTAVVVVTLVCYAGARMISFHPVDAVLYRNDLGGARLGAVIEFAIVWCVIGVTAWQAPTSRPRRLFSASQ